jgi:3-hydroxyisobutyrate dehydrogenase
MTSSDQPTVALLGTGTMGLPIGLNLLKAGLPLRAWNRSTDKAAPLAAHGAAVTESPGDAVAGAGVVVTMLYDLASVGEVMRQAAGQFQPGATWIQLSTVGVEGTAELAELAAELGLVLVDAPVLGTKKPAEDGTLTVLASGPEASRAGCEPVFQAIGARTLWLGEAGEGSKLKLVANAWVLAVLEGIAESLTLADSLGLDPNLFLQAVSGGAMDAPYVQLKGNQMLKGDWTPAFAAGGAAKDAGLILQAAGNAGVQMPITQAARGFLQQAIEDGHGDSDMAVTYLARRREG